MRRIIISILCLMILTGGMPVNAINEAGTAKKAVAVKKTNLPKMQNSQKIQSSMLAANCLQET